MAVQKFGTFLSGMIMPNIAAFIAWGLITAFFIEKGWVPVPGLGGFGLNAEGKENTGIVGPMIRYMLPILIAGQGGRMVYGVRGGVVAVVATMGVIISSEQPQFLGAMVMGPLAAWIMMQLDKIWDGKIKPGFEMLVNNFSAGIASALLAVVGFFAFGPIFAGISSALGAAVDFLIARGLLPLASLIIEPAKVLFLNNAINHGVLTPLGVNQAAQEGKSILFLLEANPGPGLGLLLAFSIFGTGMAKSTAPGAAVIQFFGGIHEIYFPYVLAKPLTLLATIGGGMVGILTLTIFGAGLRAPAAPGSIIAVLAQTPGDSLVGVSLSVLLAATTSFIIASIILRASRKRDDGDLAAATASMEAMKGKKSAVSGMLTGLEHDAEADRGAAGGHVPEQADPQHRVRLRRGHGIQCHGRLHPPQQGEEGRLRRRQGRQRRHRESDRRHRPRRHPPGPHAACQGPDAQRPARLGRQLHEQPEVRRHRGGVEAHQHSPRQQRTELSLSPKQAGGRTPVRPPPAVRP